MELGTRLPLTLSLGGGDVVLQGTVRRSLSAGVIPRYGFEFDAGQLEVIARVAIEVIGQPSERGDVLPPPLAA